MVELSPSTSFGVVPFLAAGASGGFSAGQLATVIIAIMGLTLVLLSTQRRVRQSRQNPTKPDRTLVEDAAARRATARDLEAVMLELDQLSREIHGRLNTKLVRLEALIRDADRRIEMLSRFGQAATAPSGVDVTVDDDAADVQAEVAKPRASSPSPASGARLDRHELIYRLADRGTPNVEIAREVGKTTGEVELVLALRKTRKEALSRSGG